MTTRGALIAAVMLTPVLTVACGRRSEPAKTELPSLNVTDWTDKTELYMEYPPLVTGRTTLFAVHLTRLDDFRPLTIGRPRIEFTPENGGPSGMPLTGRASCTRSGTASTLAKPLRRLSWLRVRVGRSVAGRPRRRG